MPLKNKPTHINSKGHLETSSVQRINYKAALFRHDSCIEASDSYLNRKGNWGWRKTSIARKILQVFSNYEPFSSRTHCITGADHKSSQSWLLVGLIMHHENGIMGKFRAPSTRITYATSNFNSGGLKRPTVTVLITVGKPIQNHKLHVIVESASSSLQWHCTPNPRLI